MKKAFTILIFVFSSLSYSQIESESDVYDHYNKEDTEFEKFYKNKDTLYFYFKQTKNQTKSPLRIIIPPKIYEKQYRFLFKNNKHHYGFSFQTHKRVKTKQIEIPILKRNRKFLRKKKEEILTFCKLKKLSPKDLESFYWKNKNKVIYLIDKSENKNGNVYLKKINLFSNYRTFQ